MIISGLLKDGGQLASCGPVIELLELVYSDELGALAYRTAA